jgi:hypothetical protein
MGLFDGYDYGPQGYSDGGSLISRLLSQLDTQGQYQPSAGFAPGPMDASAAMPQQQNAPIAFGDYMMPRVGGGFPQGNPNYPYSTPQEGTAQPPMQAMAQMQPQAAPQAPPPPILRPQGNGVGDHLVAGLRNFATGGGLLSAIVNGATGFATGQRTDPAGLQQQSVQQTYQSLIAAGVPEPKARLAAINPEYGKTIVADTLGPQTLTPLGEGYVADRSGNIKRAYEPGEKFQIAKGGQDGLGRETSIVFNKSTGEYKPVTVPGADGAQSGGIGNLDLTGKEYLASIPAAQRGIVQGMVDGTIAPPSSFALAKPYWQNMIAAAKNFDPTFDAANWSGRVAGVKDFSAGKSSEMVRSANQTLHHVGALIDSMDDLKNGDYPLKNRIGNALAEATGSGAQGSFRSNAHAVATELSKVFKGSNLSDAEVHAWEQNLHENMSPEQQRTQIAKLGELLHGSLQALEEKRINSIGPVAAEKQGPLVKEEGQRVLDRIQQWIAKNGASETASVAPPPLKVGESATVGKVTIKKVAP